MNSQRGQVLLIVVLIMVVALTIGLAVASRSITNVRTSTEEENSQRAFSAAEAGIERFLKTPCTSGCSNINDNFSENVTYSASASVVSGAEFLIHGGSQIPKDNGADVWLSDYSTIPADMYKNQVSTALTFYFGESANACENAALEVMVIYNNPGGVALSPATKRYAFDPCDSRRSANNFDVVSGGGTVSSKDFQHSVVVNINNGILVRVIPLYQSAVIGLKACDADGVICNALPSQGKNISSLGKSGQTERKITFYQGYPELPTEFFKYVLFSP